MHGNSHGLQHAKKSGHIVSVKLGSITPDGNADVFCYACEEERSDPSIAQHLAHWGINIAQREKTEKSLTEMQIEQNLRWEFSMTTEDGRELDRLFGEGFTGLKNLGNSCYMASIMQCLFDLPVFQQRYMHPQDSPPVVQVPAEDLETQLRKMADGLLSGRYSYPDSDVIASDTSTEIPYQKGLAPAMLKYLIGRGHEEFSTMRQQDAFEFLIHLLKLITRSSHASTLQDPVESFRFVMEQRLQCLACRKVRYRTDEQDNLSIPVPVRRLPKLQSTTTSDTDKVESHKDEFAPVTLKECLDIFTTAEAVELACPSCHSTDGFLKRSLFKTFPTTLAINVRRFELVNWVPTKLDVPVVVGDERFDLDSYMSLGLQLDEDLLPDDVASSSEAAFKPNEIALSQLEAMGFPRIRCERALYTTGSSDADTAMNWLFAHMEDPDIDEPLDLGPGNNPTTANVESSSADEENVATLGAMGIEPTKARKALRETGNSLERALDWVFSHPDDAGEEAGHPDGPASLREGGKENAMPGSANLPATFRLASIVCHKGSSIHAG